MEIEGFRDIANILAVAKRLYDMDRYDIVEKEFFDCLSYDAYFENMLSAIHNIFTTFSNNYEEEKEIEIMVFSDEVITSYFYLAGVYIKKKGLPHDANPLIEEAENEIHRHLNFSYSLDYKLLGYTKSKRHAKKSKLLVMTYVNDFYEYDHLAFGLLEIYEWFQYKNRILRNLLQQDGKAA